MPSVGFVPPRSSHYIFTCLTKKGWAFARELRFVGGTYLCESARAFCFVDSFVVVFDLALRPGD